MEGGVGRGWLACCFANGKLWLRNVAAIGTAAADRHCDAALRSGDLAAAATCGIVLVRLDGADGWSMDAYSRLVNSNDNNNNLDNAKSGQAARSMTKLPLAQTASSRKGRSDVLVVADDALLDEQPPRPGESMPTNYSQSPRSRCTATGRFR